MKTILATYGLDGLPRDERIALAQELWNSVIAEAPPGLLTPSQLAELERRADEDDANPDDVIPWETVKAKTDARLRSISENLLADDSRSSCQPQRGDRK